VIRHDFRVDDAPAVVPLDGVTIAIIAGGVRAPAPVAFDHFAIRRSDCSGF
jgi:hypothetical protein